MKESVLDIAENYLGQKVNKKTLKSFSKLSHKQQIELHDHIKSFYHTSCYFADTGGLPHPSPDTVRHVILTDSEGEMDSWEIWHEDEGDKLKKLLLYFPSIAVLDPVDELLSSAGEVPNTFERAFAPLVPIRSLIDSGVVRLVPGLTGMQTVINQIELGQLFRTVLAGADIFDSIKAYDPDNYDYLVANDLDLPGMMLTEGELDAVRSQVRAGFSRGLMIWVASVIKEIHSKYLLADLADGNMTFVADKDWQFHGALIGVDHDKLSNLGRVDDNIASLMLSLSLPNIRNLAWDDILAIRDNDQDFYYWRDSFKQVIKDSYRAETLSEPAFMKNAKETLAARARQLKESVKQKSSLKEKMGLPQNLWVEKVTTAQPDGKCRD